MKKFIMIRSALVLGWVTFSLAAPAHAEDFYIAQNASGAGSGADAANAKSVSFFNTSSSWSSPSKIAGKIGPGDTVHLSGTVTTPLVFQASGTAGNVIELLFENGAKMSKGHWNQGGANRDAAIYANGRNYITVDLGSNGVIEATSNGTGLATQLDCSGVYFDSCSFSTLKNGTIRNFYVRTQGPETNYICAAANFNDGGNTKSMLVDGVTMANAGTLINLTFRSTTDFEIRNCTLSSSGIAVNLGSASTNVTASGILIHNNKMSMDLSWSGYSGVHKNHIHAFAFQTGSRIDGMKVYNNQFSGYMGDNSTAFVFLEGYIYAPIVYNNVFKPSTNDFTGNGYVTIKGTQNAVVANNTFYGATDGVGVGTTGFGALGTGLVVKNNVMYNVATPIYDQSGVWRTAGASYDYNLYYPSSSRFYAGTGADTFAQWQSETGADTHSVINLPLLDLLGVPTSLDTTIAGTGVNLSSLFTTDKNSAPRAATGSWDLGAFVTGSSGTILMPSNAHINITAN